MNRLLFFTVFCLICAISNAQDKIKLKTGDIIKSRVLKVSGTEITYYKIYKLKDPKLKLPKSDVEYIQYENGKIVYMSAKNPIIKGTSGNPKKVVKKKVSPKKK